MKRIVLMLVVFMLPGVVFIHAAQQKLDNEEISVWFDENGNLFFHDKLKQTEWSGKYTGWVRLSDGENAEKISLTRSKFSQDQSADTIFFRFANLEGQQITDVEFRLEGKVYLGGSKMAFELTGCQTRLELLDIEYPAHLLHMRSGMPDAYIAVPHLQGIIIPSRYDAGFMRYGQNIWDLIADQEKWWNFESGNLNMPWFGASRGNSSILVRVLTPSDGTLHLVGNAVVGPGGTTVNAHRGENPGIRMSSLSTIWKASKGELSYPRKMCIETVENGYVGMARRYKQYALESGHFVTLKEKIRKNPEVEKIIGAPDIKVYCYTHRLDSPYFKAWSEPVLNGYTRVNTTFPQVASMAEELSDMGVERCMFLLAGWNRAGYDREHVDMWPPAEAAGGAVALARACETVKARGFLFALHDNYDDFYPDAPSYDEKYIIKDKDGSLHQGGVWDGGLCHIICPAVREELLDRNLANILGNIPLNGYYFDVITNTSHYECYDPRHPLTRRGDLEWRLKLLENVSSRGLVVGGERGTEWALPAVAFCEGLSGGGTGYHRGIAYRTGLTVPLFYLVYRECVVGYWQHGTPYGREDHANHVLLDALYGQPSSWSLEYSQWADLKSMIVETYELLGKFHRETAHLAMVNHHFLTPDYMVQRTELEDGTSMWVNFGITRYQSGDLDLPPKSLIMERPGQKPLKAVVSRKINYLQR